MSFLSSIFAPGEQERGDELDARLAALNQQARDEGKISDTELARRNQAQAESYIDVGSELNASFAEGAAEGYNAETGFLKKLLKAPLQFIWDSLPWQVILIALVALFVYMGGFAWLKGRIK